MASIQPFRATRPNPRYADQLVFTKPQAESVAGDHTREGGLKPLKALLETGARLRPETPEGQVLAYRDIRDTLQSLLAGRQLVREEKAGLFIYEVVHETYRQTGVWALTDLGDYMNGSIRKHELTFADSLRRIKNYRENTGIEGSPVLLTYPGHARIDKIIAQTKMDQPCAALGNEHGLHRLWKMEDAGIVQQLVAAFANVEATYLADGHHRLEAAARLLSEQEESGSKVCRQISALYMATGELRIREFHRVVVPDSLIDQDALFKALNKYFIIQESRKAVEPTELHRLGMYLYGQWYHLLVKANGYLDKSPAAATDPAILQEQVLAAIFGITDPKTDARLKCAGGEKAMEEIGAILEMHPGAVVFTLAPLGMDQLVAVADAGETLPPKSTWIDPKIPYGLLLYRHE